MFDSSPLPNSKGNLTCLFHYSIVYINTKSERPIKFVVLLGCSQYSLSKKPMLFTLFSIFTYSIQFSISYPMFTITIHKYVLILYLGNHLPFSKKLSPEIHSMVCLEAKKKENNINTLQKINIKFFLKSHRNITRIHKKFNLQKAS